MLSKTTLAKLGPGSTFGGGVNLLGSGEAIASLKVFADTPMEVLLLNLAALQGPE